MSQAQHNSKDWFKSTSYKPILELLAICNAASQLEIPRSTRLLLEKLIQSTDWKNIYTCKDIFAELDTFLTNNALTFDSMETLESLCYDMIDARFGFDNESTNTYVNVATIRHLCIMARLDLYNTNLELLANWVRQHIRDTEKSPYAELLYILKGKEEKQRISSVLDMIASGRCFPSNLTTPDKEDPSKSFEHEYGVIQMEYQDWVESDTEEIQCSSCNTLFQFRKSLQKSKIFVNCPKCGTQNATDYGNYHIANQQSQTQTLNTPYSKRYNKKSSNKSTFIIAGVSVFLILVFALFNLPGKDKQNIKIIETTERVFGTKSKDDAKTIYRKGNNDFDSDSMEEHFKGKYYEFLPFEKIEIIHKTPEYYLVRPMQEKESYWVPATSIRERYKQ